MIYKSEPLIDLSRIVFISELAKEISRDGINSAGIFPSDAKYSFNFSRIFFANGKPDLHAMIASEPLFPSMT